MSVSVSMYRSEKFERDDTVSRDISNAGTEDKYLIKYLPDGGISEKLMSAKMDSDIRKIKADDCSINKNKSHEEIADSSRLEEDSSNDSAYFQGKNKKDNVSQTHSKSKTLKQENLDDDQNALAIKKTSFSVSDILDPQKFIGCNGNRTPVWHPWLRDDVVQDYSKSNLEREEKIKGVYKQLTRYLVTCKK